LLSILGFQVDRAVGYMKGLRHPNLSVGVVFIQLRLKTPMILRPSTTSQPSLQIINLNILNYALASCEQNALFEIILGGVVDLILN
jgi:hypothetical protein